MPPARRARPAAPARPASRPDPAPARRPDAAPAHRPDAPDAPDTSPPRVLVLHGPNLNLLGTREPDVYGTATLSDIDRRILRRASSLGLVVDIHQSNHEGVLIDLIHAARVRTHAIVINPGALTHTSVALRDALAAVALPAIEVHLTNTLAREPFRHTSLVGPVCAGRIEGLGPQGYELALDAVASLLRARP